MMFYRRVGKRAMDMTVGVVALPLLGLISCVVAVAIKADDAGPVFYASTRRGQHGRPFTMLKFRSMKVGAPDLRNPDGSTVSSTTDIRVTRVGRILRLTSIDELPQLLNVLRGDMSVVGPRPNMYSTPYSSLSPADRRRIDVRPGVTGYAQAKYRNSVDTATKVAADLHYVDRLAFGFDCRVILTTIVSVLKARNINQVETGFSVGP